ncbi:hypothetical protein OC844_002823 [Tilletia horrida]|nr:hypothetical protein OC844_002823 [Tilletia horrida]
MAGSSTQHWLMKAEPDSRMEKGVDVAFSVDHFEKIGTTTWDGVRNPEAKTIMKEKMKLKDQVLFYHSNCALPGVAALAEVTKEGYPDHTAWDPKHPYFDPKTDKDNPKWFMVDCTFRSRLPHFVPLALLQHIASGALTAEQKEQVPFLTPDHIKAFAGMALLNRGRLSVQPVPPLAYDGIVLLGTKGGFSSWPGKWNKSGSKGGKRKAASTEGDEGTDQPAEDIPASTQKKGRTGAKTKDVVKEEPKASKNAKKVKKEEPAAAPVTQGRRSVRLQKQ